MHPCTGEPTQQGLPQRVRDHTESWRDHKAMGHSLWSQSFLLEKAQAGEVGCALGRQALQLSHQPQPLGLPPHCHPKAQAPGPLGLYSSSQSPWGRWRPGGLPTPSGGQDSASPSRARPALCLRPAPAAALPGPEVRPPFLGRDSLWKRTPEFPHASPVSCGHLQLPPWVTFFVP